LSVTVTIQDPPIALIRAVEPQAIQELFTISPRSTTRTVHFKITDLHNTIPMASKNRNLALFRIEGLRPGRTELHLTIEYFFDDTGQRASPTTRPGLITVLDAAGTPPPAPPSPPQGNALALRLESRPVLVGATESLELILTQAPTGLQSIGIKTTISNPAVAQFVDLVSLTIDPPFLQIISRSPSAIEFRLVDFREQIRAGASNIPLAALRLRGLAKGRVTIVVEIRAFMDDAGRSWPAWTWSVELSVAEARLPPLPGAFGSPQDLDNDGLYEDVDGDGKLTYNDPILLAFKLDNPIIQGNKTLFDFNHDGVVDFADAVALAALVAARN
jgi:hypothetical protein